MISSKRVWVSCALATMLFGATGCGENNEDRLKGGGTTVTAPDAVATPEDSLKQGLEAKQVAPKGYPGAGTKRRK
jgi:hypothetical protein